MLSETRDVFVRPCAIRDVLWFSVKVDRHFWGCQEMLTGKLQEERIIGILYL